MQSALSRYFDAMGLAGLAERFDYILISLFQAVPEYLDRFLRDCSDIGMSIVVHASSSEFVISWADGESVQASVARSLLIIRNETSGSITAIPNMIQDNAQEMDRVRKALPHHFQAAEAHQYNTFDPKTFRRLSKQVVERMDPVGQQTGASFDENF
ncbi:MAG: hypothetical protein IPH75_14775 [bacterium]|nr:hypothetical protein [bacterium]